MAQLTVPLLALLALVGCEREPEPSWRGCPICLSPTSLTVITPGAPDGLELEVGTSLLHCSAVLDETAHCVGSSTVEQTVTLGAPGFQSATIVVWAGGGPDPHVPCTCPRWVGELTLTPASEPSVDASR